MSNEQRTPPASTAGALSDTEMLDWLIINAGRIRLHDPESKRGCVVQVYHGFDEPDFYEGVTFREAIRKAMGK